MEYQGELVSQMGELLLREPLLLHSLPQHVLPA
jgi:hypothetical protein